MKRTNKELDELIDQVASGIRNENIDAAESNAAAERVWAKVANPGTHEPVLLGPVDEIRGCADFQALIPGFLAGSLSPARTILVEDHTHECVPCRKALKLARSGEPSQARPEFEQTQAGGISRFRWALAAAIIVCAALALIWGNKFFGPSSRFAAVVYAMDGSVYQVTDQQSQPLALGSKIKAGDRVRVARDGNATIKLPDGSLVEVNGRSEVSFSDSSDGTSINLDRGNVIVEAAKQQKSRHLYVKTGDCIVSVVGTIFAVDHGMKGSRVSVVQGQVNVDYSGEKHVLTPGQQVSTTPGLKPVPVKYDISWSKKQGKYLELLAQIASLKQDLKAVSQPGLRYSTNLLDMMPPGTVLYVGIPNISATLEQSSKIINDRIQQNPALRDWWNDQHKSGDLTAGLSSVVKKIAPFARYVGDELVVSAGMDAQGQPESPLLVTTLTDPAGFRSYLDLALSQAGSVAPADFVIKIVDDPATVTAEPNTHTIYGWISGDTFAASPSLTSLQALAAVATAPGSNSFRGTSFYSDIAAVYQQGAGFVVAADLEQIMARLKQDAQKSPSGAGEIEAYTKLGLLSLKHFILNTSETGGQMGASAVLSFNQADRGIPSWLAAPGPMGSLEYISPDANLVAAFVVKNPSAMLDDLIGAVGGIDPSLPQDLNRFQTEMGVDIRKDFAGTLGGEYAFAIDGPVLPVPSWKMVLEVYDQAHLQQTMQQFVAGMTQEAAKRGGKGLSIEETQVGGQTYYSIKSLDIGLEFNYTYSNGYMIAGPSRAVIDQALRYQQSGYSLVHSSQFLAALPADGNANFSAILYHNLGSVLSSLAGQMAQSVAAMPQDKQQALKSLTSSKPSLAFAYAEGDHIRFGATGDGGPFGLNPTTLLGMPNAFELQSVMGNAAMHN
ncbi:MAG TPA: FecR domain-containing protein [Blastocatellia bacterium]|nr:FecR domain-containing protein [Blastocatellia bacterium]